MPTRTRVYGRYALAAAQRLGQLVQIARKQRRMTAQELAERLGVARGTVQRLEAGDPKVEIGLAFEACALMNIRLFDSDMAAMTAQMEDNAARLALLPRYARPRTVTVDDDF